MVGFISRVHPNEEVFCLSEALNHILEKQVLAIRVHLVRLTRLFSLCQGIFQALCHIYDNRAWSTREHPAEYYAAELITKILLYYDLTKAFR